MKFIHSIQTIQPQTPNGTTIVYMLGYGGRLWQAKRHLNLLRKEGFTVLVMDFEDILKSHNPADLVGLMDEVSQLLQDNKLLSKSTLLVGVSLGGLVGYNLIRRHPEFKKLLVVTGGDMTHIPGTRALKTKWKLTRPELAEYWKDVNIYTAVGALRDKRVVMLLPKRDRVIDPDEVAQEIARHTKHNDFTLLYRPGGHFRTIITETIVQPKKSLQIIKDLLV